VRKILKSVIIWQSYKQKRGYLMHFARLANTLIKDEESARDNHVLACHFLHLTLPGTMDTKYHLIGLDPKTLSSTQRIALLDYYRM